MILKGIIRASGLIFATFIIIGVFGILYPLGPNIRNKIGTIWHRAACFFLGIRVMALGNPLMKKRGFIVSNHISYLDIPVLGSFSPVRFVAKSDISKWPVFGFLCKVGNTEFVEKNPRKANLQNIQMKAALKEESPLVLFPEGTNTDGFEVRPFKSSLFQSLFDHGEGKFVQAVSLVFLNRRTGAPLSDEECKVYTWPVGGNIFSHMWKVLCSEGVMVRLYANTTKAVLGFGNRKELCRVLEKQVVESHGLLMNLSLFEQIKPAPIANIGIFAQSPKG